MKRFLRNFFSGHFLIILILLLELAAFIIVQFFLEDILMAAGVVDKNNDISLIVILLYIAFRVTSFIFAFILFFKILNKPEDPEFKIPWIVGLFIMPFFVTMLFLIFGNHGLRKKEKRIMKASKEACEEHFALNKKEKDLFIGELDHAYGAFNYLGSTTGLGIHKNNRVTYYKDGETFFPEMIESLKKAKEFIFMEFFIISDGKLWDEVTEILKKKAQEGVEVRLIYDDMGCSGTISSFTPRRLRKFGIKCYKFHPFRPILSGVYNNRDHRKIVIIDHQIGYTGGMNLADEYANIIKRFGYWKDTMVKIEGSAINNLIVTFLQNYDLSSHEISDYKKYLTFDYPKYEEEGFIMPFGDGPGGIDDALVGEQTYVNLLSYAKKTAFISTPYLVPTYELLDAMRNAALRGVDVRLIIPGIPDKKAVYKVAQSHFRYLLDAGVKIYTYTPGFNHMKTTLIDDELAFVGTINFDFRSLVHHFECGTILYKNPCLKDIREDFDEMIKQSKEIPFDFKMKKGTKWFCSIIKLITPLL